MIKKTQTLLSLKLLAPWWQPGKTYWFEESQLFEDQWKMGECAWSMLSITLMRLGYTTGIFTWVKKEQSSLKKNHICAESDYTPCKSNASSSGDLRSEKWWGRCGLGSRNEAAWGSDEFLWDIMVEVFCLLQHQGEVYRISYLSLGLIYFFNMH